jgi:hypothetical protein
LLYVVPGVINDAAFGLVTAFVCTNVSAVSASMSIFVRSGTGAPNGNRVYNIPSNQTATISTRFSNLYHEFGELGSTTVRQGRATIYANNRNVHCTAHVVSSTSALPNTIDLHMVRYNPAAGTSE